MCERVTPQLTEERIRELAERYHTAYEARDVNGIAKLFADDAVITLAPGTFFGKDGARAVYDWDVRIAPTVKVRLSGIGLLVKGNVAVREAEFDAVYEGVRYQYPCVTVLEFNDDGTIRSARSYYDKLGIEQRIARRLPGIRGFLLRTMVNFLVAQGEKGLRRPAVAGR